MSIFAMILLLLSCQREPVQKGYEYGEELQKRDLELSFNLDAGRTKAAIGGTEDTKVTKLAVIARPVKSSTSASWSKAIVTEFDNPTINAGRFTGTAEAYVGNNIFYVLVNYTDEMIGFVNTQAVAAGKGFRENRESAFIPALGAGGFGQKQEELVSGFKDSDRGIAMMAKCIDEGGNNTVLITPSTTALTLSGVLHRMIANVHVEFEVYEQATDQVVVMGYIDKHQSEIPNSVKVHGLDSGKKGSQAGWVPLSSIRYCLNAVNTRVFLEASDSCNSSSLFPYDPNFLLDNTLVTDGADWNYADGYENDFLFWDPNDAATLFNDNPGTSSWMVTPPTPIYCLENMVSAKDEPGSFLDGFGLNTSYRRIAPRRVTTHLLIETQFTPRYIIVGRDPAGLRDHQYRGFSVRSQALDILRDNEHLSDPGDGTFWTPDLKHFYNWDGVQAEIAYSAEMHTADNTYRQLTLDDFAKYPQGKCYYTAYISGETATDPDSEREYLTFMEGGSSMRRDVSYTLHATVLHVPSISMSMMEINTRGTLTWPEIDGSGEINIMPR